MVKHLDVKATSNREADVHFYGKGKKHRITPLSREIWNQFEDYCEKYPHPFIVISNGCVDAQNFFSFNVEEEANLP